MFLNNVIIALRNLQKHKVFAAINISGLALGLAIFVFGSLLVRYEKTHDLFFENAERIFTIGSIAAPELNAGFNQLDATFTTVGPIIDTELEDVEHVARTVSREFLLTMGAESFYESVRFSDPDILKIFRFDYLHGDETALDDPSNIVITDDIAIKYFGETDVVGEVVTFDNEFDYRVAAVIRQVPMNSHFNSSLLQDGGLAFLAPIVALNKMRDWDVAGNWNNLSIGNMTYLLLDGSFDRDWLQEQVDSIYERLVPDDQRDVISGFTANPLSGANTAVWDLIGIPVINTVQLLSFLVLLIACVNYTNLATAQSLGRTREVGMRKTMGANQSQLLAQFLIESLVIATIAMVIALAALEVIIPLFNNASGKVLSLDYVATLPWLTLTTVLVGLLAGLYPAWLITRATPIQALRDFATKGRKGSKVRSFMIGVQFAISAFMLATVSIVYMQNERIKDASYEFPRSQIYTIDRLNIDGITENLDTLKNEIEAIPNVAGVAFSSQVPYEQSNSNSTFTTAPGDEASEFSLQRLNMSPDFLKVYDIPVLEGRGLSRDISNDVFSDESEVLNVLVNELALPILGFDNATDAINQRFYTTVPDSTLREFVIVGVVPTQNIVGLFNQEKAWFYEYAPAGLRIGSVRIAGGNMMDTVAAIEKAWDRVIPDYPIQGRFLDEVFDDIFSVLRFMNMALAGFAFVALSLALIGLFGLAAFMAALRTKEIGVRKVLGASSAQIARLLVWQFSQPVLWALLVALPLAYFSSQLYLNFFADRIDSQIAILFIAGLISALLAWGTIAAHAIRIARANPIGALRYE